MSVRVWRCGDTQCDIFFLGGQLGLTGENWAFNELHKFIHLHEEVNSHLKISADSFKSKNL